VRRNPGSAAGRGSGAHHSRPAPHQAELDGGGHLGLWHRLLDPVRDAPGWNSERRVPGERSCGDKLQRQPAGSCARGRLLLHRPRPGDLRPWDLRVRLGRVGAVAHRLPV